MTKSRLLIASMAAAALAGCGTSPVEVSSLESRFEGGCITLAPAVTVNQAPDQPDPARQQPVDFVVQFEVPVSGFGVEDLVIGGSAGAGAKSIIKRINDRTYRVSVTNISSNGTVTLSVPASAASSLAPCVNLTAASTSTDNSVEFLGRKR